MYLYKLQLVLFLVLAIYFGSAKRHFWSNWLNIILHRSNSKSVPPNVVPPPPAMSTYRRDQHKTNPTVQFVAPSAGSTESVAMMDGVTGASSSPSDHHPPSSPPGPPDPPPSFGSVNLPKKPYKLKEEKFIMGVRPHELAFTNAYVGKIVCYNFLIHYVDLIATKDAMFEYQEHVQEIKNIEITASYKEQNPVDYKTDYEKLKTTFVEKFSIFTSNPPNGKRLFLAQSLILGNPFVLDMLASDTALHAWLRSNVFIVENAEQAPGRSGPQANKVYIPALGSIGTSAAEFVNKIDEHFKQTCDLKDPEFSGYQWKGIRYGANISGIPSTDKNSPTKFSRQYVNDLRNLLTRSHNEFHRIRHHLLHMASSVNEKLQAVSEEQLNDRFLPVFGFVLENLSPLFIFHSANYWSSFLHIIFGAVNINAKQMKLLADNLLWHVAWCAGVTSYPDHDDFKTALDALNSVILVDIDDDGNEVQVGPDNVRYLYILIRLRYNVEVTLKRIIAKVNRVVREERCTGNQIFGTDPIMRRFIHRDVLLAVRNA